MPTKPFRYQLFLCLTLLFGPAMLHAADGPATFYVGPDRDDYTSIQQAIDDAAAGDILIVKEGEYTENINIGAGKTGLKLLGETDDDGTPLAKVNGLITVVADEVQVSHLYITNPAGTSGILVRDTATAVEGVVLSYNVLEEIGISANSHSQAIYLERGIKDALVANNRISNIGNPNASGAASNKGITVGDSTAVAGDNIVIRENSIQNVNAKTTSGAYGILVSHEVTNLSIENNQISTLNGYWVHAIGLEGSTPEARIIGNRISNLTATKTTPVADEVAIFFENNAGTASTVLRDNHFAADIAWGVAAHPINNPDVVIDATENYWGGSDGPLNAAANGGPKVLYLPWYADSDLTQLSYSLKVASSGGHYTSIAEALAAAVPGTTINVAAGTYTSALVVDKDDISIVGNGDSGAEASIISCNCATTIAVNADGLTLSGLRIAPGGGSANYGLNITSDRSGLSITDTTVTGFNSGLKVADAASLTDLTVSNSHFDGNRFGWYIAKSVANDSMVDGVEVSNTSFNDNSSKAIYAEKLSNAVFDGIEVVNSGTDLVTWPPSNGIDINLKWSEYRNITFTNSEFRNNGLYSETTLGDLSGALVIKARDDDPLGTPDYSGTQAASLDGVTITNNVFAAEVPLALVAVRLGEPLPEGSSHSNINSGPTSVTISGNEFEGFDRPFLNLTQAGTATSLLANNSFAEPVAALLHAGTVQGVYTKVNLAAAAAESGDVIQLSAGTFAENVVLKQVVTLKGAGASSVIAPASGHAIAIAGNTNPGLDGITIEQLATSSAIIALSGAAPADTYDTKNLTLRNLSIDAAGSGFGIGLFDVDGATLQNITINNHTSDTLGALELVGVRDLVATGITVNGGGLGFNMFAASGYAANGNASITQSRLTSLKAVDAGTIVATNNWWGSAGTPAARVQGATFSPWYVNSALTTLSNAVPPPPPPEPAPQPEPEPIPEDIQDLISDVEIPADEEVSEAVLDQVATAAESSANLAQQLASNIATVSTGSALEALTAISSVAEISGSATANTATHGNSGGAASSSSAGAKALNSFSTLLSSLDKKLNRSTADNTPPPALAEEEKATVQQAAVKAVASAVSILSGADADTRREVLQSVGHIVTSSVNLGVPLTSEQTTTLLTVTSQNAGNSDDPESLLENSVPLQPRNKELISRAALSEALTGTGITDEEIDEFLNELAAAINPADVQLGDVNGGEALNNGFNSALGGTSGGISFDPATGVVAFTLGATGTAGTQEALRSLQALTTAEVVLPGRVVSTNVVAPNFPDGITQRANGAVVITSNRIASIVVPASWDPLNFYADLRSLGTPAVDADGNVTITGADKTFSATFDYRGITQGGAPLAATQLLQPDTTLDPSNPRYFYTVVYRDGVSQRLLPFVQADGLVTSLRALGLKVSTNRNNGVVTVSGRHFRPSYFVTPPDSSAQAFWNQNKDAHGLAYRSVHANADGIPDIEIISASGVQVAYGL